MWNEPNPDPGGNPSEGTSKSSRELTDLQDENEQQKLLIAQLKEMLRKEQSTVTQEKVEEYVNTLSKLKAKKSRIKKDESGSIERGTVIDSVKKEKVNLLKQQLEENKAKLAERGKNQKGIEEMVTQLKAQLNDSQQLINATPLNLSVVDQKNLDYNKSTSQEELYNILIVKERKVTELLNKTQKQEATILDLQENLKEKDSVIDARTKAITLMTDSLSKKGKDTLDALDETKEQMRTMQENFVKLESEMKARQLKLLEDLKAKNLEITELRDLNDNLLEDKSKLESHILNTERDDTLKQLQEQFLKLKIENENYLTHTQELEKKLQDAHEDINRFKSTGVNVQPIEGNDNEVAKLKKQLEDSNKNMIKIKAQSKSKIKELTKQVEAFKKTSDVNALVLQLQNDNTKLSEKIAELEEEKGNMQLKMVESTDSTKEVVLVDEAKDVQEKLLQNSIDIEEKNKVITLLEADIISLKEEINGLRDELSGISHFEHVQVTSEIKSIEIEEQLEKLEHENKLLKETIESVDKERKELEDKIEDILKEKQELSNKLDNCIQENIELIDKLEKLSAEKVSSAESIEIVEGLTQQEKLELAAYQKHLDVNLEETKSAGDDICEPPPELNESVLQLNEDSTELLKKIEMFNAERKEVMTKMEELREENNRLNMKITEIENSRDVLADTYEQLQSEKEELQTQYDHLLKKTENMGIESENKVILSDDSDLGQLQIAYENLQKENENLKTTLKEFDTKFHEKDNLDSELQAAHLKIENLESKLKSNLEELTNYRSIIEENNTELVTSSNLMNDLQTRLSDRENDINELNTLLNDLHIVVANLQTENEKLGNFEVMESQVEELKSALNNQIEQAQDYAEEIAYSNNIITDLKEKLEEMNKKILETEHEMEIKTTCLEKMKVELLEKDDMIKNLQNQVTEKDRKINILADEMKERYLVLQKQLDGNNSSLEQKIEELTNKNKEQLEKMKKIAANLKRKTQAYQELEETYLKEKEKWETEVNKKEVDHLNLLSQVKELKGEINNKTVKLEESESKMRDLTLIIQNLEQDLHNSSVEMRRREEKLNEVSLKQELSRSLHEEFEEGLGNTESANEEKIRELQLIIETNEADLTHYKERLQKLDEDLVQSSEDKYVLENKLAELQQQLQLSSQSIQEKTVLEETLEQRLEEVSANDEVLSKKLKEATEENSDLLRKSGEHEETIVRLKIKLKKAHEKVTQLKSQNKALEEFEYENGQLKKQLAHLEANTKHIQDDCEAKHKQNQKDYERIEADYQGQLEELLQSKNELLIDCEKLREELKSAKEKEEEFLEELGVLRKDLQEMDKLKEDVNAAKEREDELLTETAQLKTNGDNNKREIERLSHELEIMTANWNSSITRVDELNNQISTQHIYIENLTVQTENLEKQLVVETAKDTVEDVITDAKDKLFIMNSKEVQTEEVDIEKTQVRNIEVPQEAVPTFQWSQSQEFNPHWDAFVQQTEPAQNVAPNTVLSNLESQIFSPADIADASNNKKELQKIEFEQVSASLGEQTIPVVEEVMKPKHAYLTYQPGVEAFGENDDGWGWGPEEAKLEEEHQFRAECTPQMQNLRTQLAQALEKLQVFQVERENHLEEIKQLQIKSGKLIKKCKELKVQNDHLSAQKPAKKSSGEDFFNLDDTIQEELKSQIAQLEKRIKEVIAELEREKLEKTKIVKQVDVLTTANERMVENKEIQDAEIFRWKRKYEEMEEKLQQVEWSSDGFSEHPKPKPPTDQNETIEDLQKQIQELSQDNEELQLLLNEQRELRIQAEKLKVADTFPQFSQELDSKIKMLEQELTGRNREIEAVMEEKNRMIDSLQKLVEEKNNVIDSIEEEMRSVEDKNKDLEKLFKETENYVKELNQKLEIIEGDKIKLETEISEKDANFDSLQASFKQVQTDTSKDDQINDLESRLSQLENEKYYLEIQLKEKEQYLQSLLETHQHYASNQNEIEELKFRLSQSEESKIQLEALINEKDTALERLKETYENHMNLSESFREQSENLSVDLANLHQKYQELQNTVHKNESELQEELQKQKLNYEQLHKEQSDKLEEVQKKYDDLQIESKQTIVSLEQKMLETDGTGAQEKLVQLESMLEERKEHLRELEKIVETSHMAKEELEKEVQKLKNDLETKTEEYERLVNQMEEEVAKKVTELEDKWIVQVDERGNAVAESWKFHLALVEQEFETVRDKMKNEINELEEKCNALVNENNELRKNVDEEIRNEVDRMTAAQQSITDLSKKLAEKEQEITQMTVKVEQVELLETKLLEYEQEVTGLKLFVSTTKKQFEDKRQVVEDIIKILEKRSPWPISTEKDDILEELHRQLHMIQEKDTTIEQLTKNLNELESKIQNVEANMIQEKDTIIEQLTKNLNELESKIQNVEAKEEEIQKLETIISDYQKEDKDKNEYIETAKVKLPKLEHELQQKDREIEKLWKLVEENKVQVEKIQEDTSALVEERAKLNQVIEDYKKKLEVVQQTNIVLEDTLIERNIEIKASAEKLSQIEGNKNDNNKEIERLQSEITVMKQNYGALQQLLQESQQEQFTVTQELVAKTHELDTVRQQVVYLQQYVEILENEVTKLKDELQSKDQEFTTAYENLKKSRLIELETHYEEVIAAKDIDNNTLTAQLAEVVQHSQSLSNTIGMEVQLKQDLENKCLQLEQKVSEETALIEEDEKQLTELRSIIEEQAATIDEMKKELYEKSKDYDSLVAEVDMGRQTITTHETSGAVSASTSKSQYFEEDLSEPVSRAELDLALYMLHQRDVRCEELTVELTQLLEERDTLQLRLSNAIREKEEFRRKLPGTEADSLSISSNPELGTPISKSSAIFLAATGTELATDPLEATGSDQDLANKLSELRKVGYKRDKTFVDEQQQRRLQQISIMQQHINEASKLPPEAAAKLVDATYTLSRDVQSPSKVLLNWLWGRSTPKQNDT